MHDDLDDLVGAAPARVRRWMERKARLADARSAGSALVDAASVDQVLAAARRTTGDWLERPRSGPARDLWAVVRVGLLFDLAGLTHGEIAVRLGVTTTFVGRQRIRHRALLRVAAHADRIAALVTSCLSLAYPSPTPLPSPAEGGAGPRSLSRG